VRDAPRVQTIRLQTGNTVRAKDGRWQAYALCIHSLSGQGQATHEAAVHATMATLLRRRVLPAPRYRQAQNTAFGHVSLNRFAAASKCMTRDGSPHIAVLIGTRPEAIKLMPVIRALEDAAIPLRVLVTGQHRELLDPILAELAIKPDENLQVMTSG